MCTLRIPCKDYNDTPHFKLCMSCRRRRWTPSALPPLLPAPCCVQVVLRSMSLPRLARGLRYNALIACFPARTFFTLFVRFPLRAQLLPPPAPSSAPLAASVLHSSSTGHHAHRFPMPSLQVPSFSLRRICLCVLVSLFYAYCTLQALPPPPRPVLPGGPFKVHSHGLFTATW